MSKFNSTKESTTKTVNKAGGSAYKQSPKLELASLLVTSMLNGDSMYESESDRVSRLTELVDKVINEDPTFVAKASYYARDKFHLRSISHMCSALIMQAIKDNRFPNVEDRQLLRKYFTRVIMRGDDITETLSAFQSLIGDNKVSREIPQCAKRGLGLALSNLDAYSLAKYRQANKSISMIDAVRILQPKVTDRSKEGLEKLVAGKLRNTSTWEATQSKAKEVGNEEEKKEASLQAWKDFVAKGERVEYMALLRNLRNIFETGDMSLIKDACKLLSNPDLVHNSKVLPFRFYTAYRTIKPILSGEGSRTVMKALNDACTASLDNVPELDGRTAIFIDVSGSMSWRPNGSGATPAELSGLFSAVLYKTNDADAYLFNSKCWAWTPNPNDSLFTIAEDVIEKCGGGTYMSSAFKAIKGKHYDRIIIMSDEQTWVENYYDPSESCNDNFNAYRRETNPDVRLYTVDCTGYGTMQFPEKNVGCIAGFSENILDLIKKSEIDPAAMVHEIEQITF